MVRVDGKNETWQATGLYPYIVGRAPSGWRDHAIFELRAADVDKLTVEAPGQKLVLEKAGGADKDKPSDAKWKIVESTGDGAEDVGRRSTRAQVNAVVQGLSNLHAADFADDKKVDDVKGKGLALSDRAPRARRTRSGSAAKRATTSTWRPSDGPHGLHRQEVLARAPGASGRSTIATRRS